MVYYCSKEHQKFDWKKSHKVECKPYKIQYSDSCGRFMTATRDIKQGEVILKEKPAVIGPRMYCKVQCLSCGRQLQPIPNDDGNMDFIRCSSCNWPVCGIDCEKAEVHREECKIMVQSKYKCDIKYECPDKAEAAYCVIAPLRVLLMKDSNPRMFESIMNLESHVDQRINTPIYQVLRPNLIMFIRQVLGMNFDDKIILEISSIFDNNSFDVRSADKTKRLRAIYLLASMMNHSCRPNTRHIYLGEDKTLALIATVHIAKGEEITATYTQPLWGTLDRRKFLKTNKYFDCKCERCADPTEFGTYLGNIYCTMCNSTNADVSRKGAMLVSTNPLDETALWKCENCGYFIQGRQMVWGNKALKEELSSLNKTGPQDFEHFIEKYKLTLHPRNHLLIQAKLALMEIYGNYKGYSLKELPENLLSRKIDICNELLEVAEKLDPGWSRFRGSILLELEAAMTIKIKKEFEAEMLTKTEAQNQLIENMVLLEEATNILKIEPHMNEALQTKLQERLSILDNTK
ncbi:hypothetical protein KGM_209725 [Danaus plexippus plexippus]|uniref:SET domain-containing protein n=1 Tax=Danaus plexippus plexippus TaxID=278856 RepID=A0A212F6K7_DANPL|nr:hypothetical protein KGM_209725 [Danaus plexippus plexippus]